MSETANTLIKASLRLIGAIATGETPTASEMDDGLEALQFMLRNWSSRGIRIPYYTRVSATFNGSTYYTIGSGGDIDTTRPSLIVAAESTDYPIKITDFNTYQLLSISDSGAGDCEYIWYNPSYPLGYIYPWPLSSETITLTCLVPMTEPATIAATVSFPPEYDDAIKYNLAIRLAPEYEREPSRAVVGIANETMTAIENNNFASQIKVMRPEILKLATARYDIDRY